MLQTLTITIAVALTLLTGCSDPNGRQPVGGTVTLGGAPLATGSIRFETEPGVTPSCIEGAIITAGRYEIPAATGLRPGSYRVFVSATDGQPAPASDTPPGNPVPPAREIIPARYNAETTLTAQIVPGRNAIDFALDP